MDMNLKRRKIIRKWPITYMIEQVRKVGMTLKVYMIRKRYEVEVRTGNICQKGVSIYQ